MVGLRWLEIEIEIEMGAQLKSWGYPFFPFRGDQFRYK